MSVKLSDLFSRFWTWRLDRSPEFGSLAGSKAHGDKLETWTTERFQEDFDKCQEFKTELNAIKTSERLSDFDDLNAKLFQAELDTFLDGFPFKGFLAPINVLEGPHVDFQRLPEWMSIDKGDTQDFKNLIKRYQSFPQFADGIISTLESAVALKMTNCDKSMKGVVDAFGKIQEVPADKSAFFEPFINVSDDLKAEALQAIRNGVLPGFKKIQECLETTYIPNLRPSIAATSLPNGKAFYEQCLKFHTSGSLTAQEIHDLGKQEVSRIKSGMMQIMSELGEGQDLKAFIEKLKRDPKFYYSTPKELIDKFRFIIEDQINPKLTQLFWKRPVHPLEIVEMPEAMSGGPAAYYIAGTPDGARPGRFFVNVKRYDSQPKYEMVSLALHEGNPGHHLQSSYSLSANLPLFRTVMEDRCYSMAPSRFPINTAFVEGWALYCENLGHDLGLYDDPYDRFGHLSEEIFRASRLVVDTGMHALGWSRDQAVAFMQDNTAASNDNINAEIDRYITWPGQAVGYKVGEIKISQLRKDAEEKLGSKFDIRDFHEVILKSAGPLNIVEQEVASFIKSKLS